jgi:predicted TIM-barrel fold metal-dependent hydrolase
LSIPVAQSARAAAFRRAGPMMTTIRGRPMRTIALEEHYVTPGFLAGAGRASAEGFKKARGAAGERLFAQLSDLGDKRLAEMDEAGIDMQFLSINSPGTEQCEAAEEAIATARDVNDVLADAVRRHPTRFAGLAALPTLAPDKAVDELQRRMKDGFKGAVINGHIRGRYLDDEFFWPILEAAEALAAPIYLHPTIPPKAVVDAYFGGFPQPATMILAGPAWGWHIETSVHILRMMARGVFDRFPRLQIVIGHMGEGLPFMLERMDSVASRAPNFKLQRSFSAYLRENVHYTFGGFNYTPTFLNLLLEVGVDRIMFSADYPYTSMSEAREFLEKLPVSAADRERIAHGNAEKLFKL